MSELYNVWKHRAWKNEISFISNAIILIWLYLNHFELAFWLFLPLVVLEVIAGSIKLGRIEDKLMEKE